MNYGRTLNFDVATIHQIGMLGQSVDDTRLARHLAAYDEGAARAEAAVLCPGCGHDQHDHAPDNLPPYRCTLRGCTCSRTPDHLLIEAPDEEVA
jgi:hypothetical protein